MVRFTATQATASPRKPRPDSYRKVLDSRKRRVRGLWQRNGHFYTNLTVADDLGRKTSRFVPLSGATLDAAELDYARLLTERDDDRLRPQGLTPTLGDYIAVYTRQLDVSGKRSATIEKEKAYLKRWSAKLGHNPSSNRATSSRESTTGSLFGRRAGVNSPTSPNPRSSTCAYRKSNAWF